MIGFLSPDIFEPFFDYVFTPTDDTVYTEGGTPYFNQAGFERVQSELDIVVVGPPPQRAKALDA
jgi:quercetin 2,3-dioxygenase